ncbi:uncharacterized protein LOC120340824 [Styela clava]
MERNNVRTRMWMKTFRDKQDEGNTGMSRRSTVDDSRRIYPSRRPIPPNNNATGLGFRLKVRVCPKLDQVFLAFVTILLIVSLDLCVLTIVNVGPGLMSTKFSPANCKIVGKSISNSSFCYISSIENHGKVLWFPCLRVYVTLDDRDDVNDDVTSQDLSLSKIISPPLLSVTPTISPKTDNDVIESSSVTSQGNEKLLLYQNEFHLVGGDYKTRPCSYLPDYCSGKARDIAWRVYNYSKTIGEVNDTTPCYYSTTSGLDVASSAVAMKFKTVRPSDMVHSLLWPVIGIFVSVISCTLFWKKNHHRVHRMFIYNAWSQS